MKTNKIIFKDKPTEGHVLLERTTESYRRTRNGAWTAGGSSRETFEIPLATLNTPDGAYWLNPGRCGHLTVALPDGTFLTVSGANDPISTNGFGPLARVPVGDRLVHTPHPLLPNLAPGYSRVEFIDDETAASLQPLS